MTKKDNGAHFTPKEQQRQGEAATGLMNVTVRVSSMVVEPPGQHNPAEIPYIYVMYNVIIVI